MLIRYYSQAENKYKCMNYGGVFNMCFDDFLTC